MEIHESQVKFTQKIQFTIHINKVLPIFDKNSKKENSVKN